MREPQFVSDLAARVHAVPGSEPLPPLPTRFLKKQIPDYLKRGIYRSAILHAALFVGIPLCTIAYRMTGWQAEHEARLKALQSAKSAIRVDIVDLPTLKLAQLEKVDLTKEVDDSGKAAEEIIEKPKVSDTAMIDRTKKIEEDKKKAQELAKEKSNEAKQRKEAEQRVKDLQNRLRADQKRRELIDKLKGKAGDGRPALAGNIKSEGYALTGDLASQADVYYGKARAHVLRNWNVPAWMNASNLSASMVVTIGADGKILSKRFVRRSGNSEFDGYVERAMDLSDPLPAPPSELTHTYMEDGIEWRFPN